MTFLACSLCTQLVTLAAGGVVSLAVLTKIYWSRLRHLLRGRKHKCACGCHYGAPFHPQPNPYFRPPSK